jgi:hypothetical protein
MTEGSGRGRSTGRTKNNSGPGANQKATGVGLRESLVNVALQRLVTSPLEALRLLLTPSKLIADGGAKVSRDSAYRVFRSGENEPSGADAVILDCSQRLHDPAWTGLNDTLNEIALAYFDDHATPIERLRAGLEANVTASFDSPGWPAGYLLLSAAMTCSPRWAGDRPSEKADIAFGRQVLAHQREMFDGIDAVFEPLIRGAMADLGLRPVGRTVRQVGQLMHCLLDGAVLRMFADPTLTAADIADALVRFGMSLGEPGSLDDPRRPLDDPNVGVFDDIVLAAKTWWNAHPAEACATPEEIAQASGFTIDTTLKLIRTPSDLADSVLRVHILDTGMFADGITTPHSMLAPALLLNGLDRIAASADRWPGLFAHTLTNLPTIGLSLRIEATTAATNLLIKSGLPNDASSNAEMLVNAAWAGTTSLKHHQTRLALIRALIGPSART